MSEAEERARKLIQTAAHELCVAAQAAYPIAPITLDQARDWRQVNWYDSVPELDKALAAFENYVVKGKSAAPVRTQSGGPMTTDEFKSELEAELSAAHRGGWEECREALIQLLEPESQHSAYAAELLSAIRALAYPSDPGRAGEK